MEIEVKKELKHLEKILTELDAKYRKVIIDGCIFSANSTVEDINEYLAVDGNLIEALSRLKKLNRSEE